MTSGRIYEAQRLLRRIDDRDAECSRWLVQALESIAASDANMPIKCALMHIYNALPGASLNNKEKELLRCHSQSESLTVDQPILKSTENQSILEL